MQARLAGKVALVTGAAQGIGKAIADQFEAHGAIVWRTDIQAFDGGQYALQQDVASEQAWLATLAAIEKESGRLDVLVNNAGVELEQPLSEVSLENWRKVMSVNVDGVFLGCKHAAALLAARETGYASVINISSVAGIIGFPEQPAYNTSKGAVRHLTKSLAIEWAAANTPIRCNSIHPGCIRTPMLDTAGKRWFERGLIPGADYLSGLASMCPLNEVGEPLDIAHGATYLASDESKFITGIELVIDGGFIAR